MPVNVVLSIELNKQRGTFSGVFNMTEAVNSYYDDYSGASISTLSIAPSPVLGSIGRVRVRGGSIDSDPYPLNWQVFGDAISTSTSQWNVITILYVNSNDIGVVNKVSDIPLTYSEILTNFASLALDSTQINLSNATNVRTDGSDKYLINWIDQSPSTNDASQVTDANQFQLDLTDKFLNQTGGNDYMTLGSNTVLTGTTGFSAYFVLNKDNSDDIQIILGKVGNTSMNVFTFLLSGTYYFRIFDGSNLISFPLSGAGDLLGKKIFEIHHDGSGNAELLINGTSISSITGVPNVNYTYDTFGRRDTGNNLTGEAYGVFNFNSELSDINRLTVRQELANKYGISL